MPRIYSGIIDTIGNSVCRVSFGFPRPAALRIACVLIALLTWNLVRAADALPATAPATVLGAESDLLQKLLQRIEQLERREAARAASESAPTNLVTAPLLKKISELEQKLAAIEGSKVLPEIAVTSDDAPSTTELQRKIQAIETKNAQDAATAAARSRQQPRVSIGASGFQFTSADTNFSLSLKGLVQTDHYLFVGDNPLSQGNDGFVLRRVRLAAQGTLGRNFEYLIVPQYGGYSADPVQILDASVSFKPSKSFEVRAGKFKGPVGLELLQSINVLPFNERSMVSGLVPQRSVGFQVSGSLWDGAVSASAGVFNAAGDLRNPQNFDFTDDREYAGRLFFQPFKGTELKPVKGLGFGLGGSYSLISSNVLGLPSPVGGSEPGYTTSPGVQQFFAYNPLAGPVVADGAHWRLSPQGSWYWGPFGLLGEYVVSSQGVYNSSTFRSARLAHSGWQVTADWVLTGESASFGGVTPKNPFQWGSPGWGAWQLVGRFSQFDVDKNAFPAFSNPDFSASGADAWSVGINWWLNRNARILTSFTHTAFTGGGAPPNLAAPASLLTPAIVTAQDENVVASRIQISF